jgi:hypothetical protein
LFIKLGKNNYLGLILNTKLLLMTDIQHFALLTKNIHTYYLS